MLEEGYTIGYSNAQGANYGSKKAVQDIINLHQYMVKEKVNFIRSAILSQPLLNVRDQIKYDNDYIKRNNLDMDDPLGYAIASAHETDYESLDEYIDKVFSIDELALANVPCKIWHGTEDENVPVEINALPFVNIRIKYKLQVGLEVDIGTGHDKQGACYSDHNGIIQFFHKNE